MITLTPKSPGDIIAYEVDFEPQLGCDPVVSFVQSVTDGAIAIEKAERNGQRIRLLISGGVDGEIAEIAVSATSEGGQEIAVALSLAIVAAAAPVPTTTTKRTVVNMAFEYMTLSGYEFDATPEEQFSALRALDAMMAEEQGPGRGVALLYNAPTIFGEGDLDEPIGIPDSTIRWAALRLAQDRCGTIGKALAPAVMAQLSRAQDAVNAQFAVIPERQFGRTTPRGSGQGPWSTYWPFFARRGC